MNIKKISLLHICLFLILTISYVTFYYYPLSTAPLSLLVIACLYSIILWFLGFISFAKIKNTIAFKLLGSLSLTLVTTGVILIFILNYVGNANWGTNVTFKFLIKYAQEISKLKEILPVPLSVIFILSGTLILAVFSFYFKYFSIILNFIEIQKSHLISLKVRTKQYVYILLSLFIIPFSIYLYSYTQTDQINDLWEGEPLTDLLLPYTTIIPSAEIADKNKAKNAYSIDDKIKDKPNIILIIADALRADHLKSYGYNRTTTKFIDYLLNEKKAIKVDKAFATCSESNCGILSTLSSRPFDEISPENIKINDVLKKLGYDINFILSADHSWSGLNKHYPPYDILFDGNDTTKYAVTDDNLVLDRLAEVSPYNKPAFFYFHLMSNHPSGVRKRSFNKFTPYKNPNDWFYQLPLIKDIFSSDRKSLDTNFYDNGIVGTDYYISNIFKQLTQKGYMENSIVWIISDHGEAFGEHGTFGHVKSLYNEEIRIPMIIVDEKLNLYKERNFATQLDIAPTILDRIGVKIPKTWKGKSLLTKHNDKRISHHNIPSRKGDKAIIIKDDNKNIYKVIYNDQKSFEINEVYNLNTDMSEKNNLINTDQHQLVTRLASYINKDQ